jgi:LPS-assembly lipoprotein
VVLAGMLSGCGFRPLYGDRGPDEDLEPALASVAVDSIRDRSGQELTNALRDAFNPHALSVPAAYELSVALSVNVANLMTRQNTSASRTDTTVKATWSMRRLADDKIVLSGSSKATTGHDVLTNEYANVVSGKADQTEALRQVGEDIESQVAVFLRNPK